MLADYVFRNVKFKPTDNVLSLASGTAVLENFIAKHEVPQGKVTCVDLSDGMNAVGGQISRAEGVGNIRFVSAQALHVNYRFCM